jgi:RNA polymerase sigma-70 factor, ECF subfamily
MPPTFDELVREHSGRIRQIARRYADAGSVDDLVQEILIRLWRSLPGFRGESKVGTWVYRIALNAAMTSVKASIRHRELKEAATAAQAVVHSVETGASADDILTRFTQGLGEIDASILMMYLDDLSPEDMSSVLGISPNAIAVRITRLKQKFVATYVD